MGRWQLDLTFMNTVFDFYERSVQHIENLFNFSHCAGPEIGS